MSILLDVDEAPPELKFEKAHAIGPQGHIVIDALGHIPEMRRLPVLVHHRLEVEHVECLFRARNQVIVVARRPHIGVGLQLGKMRLLMGLLRERRSAGAGEQRACSKKLDKAAAGSRFDDRSA